MCEFGDSIFRTALTQEHSEVHWNLAIRSLIIDFSEYLGEVVVPFKNESPTVIRAIPNAGFCINCKNQRKPTTVFQYETIYRMGGERVDWGNGEERFLISVYAFFFINKVRVKGSKEDFIVFNYDQNERNGIKWISKGWEFDEFHEFEDVEP